MSDPTRSDDRRDDAIRPVRLIPNFTRYAEGSVLAEMGQTKVLCTASVEETVPPFLRETGQGWVTAEYGMLPRSTHTRTDREAARGKVKGRTQEIQRLIGRSLRAVTNLQALGEKSILIDCDVLQADGGTRTAAITGAWVALVLAVDTLKDRDQVAKDPIERAVAAVSAGVVDGRECLDLDYGEDSRAEVDMNFVMNDRGQFVEVQGTAEGTPFSREQLDRLADLGWQGIRALLRIQQETLEAARSGPANSR